MAMVLAEVLPDCADVAGKLNITPLMLERICEDDRHVKPWMMRWMIDKYRVNPLYIYGGGKEMFLKG